ncbi:MAG: SCP2 sterol-binding domain-containing protein [bacterium]
MPKFATMEWGEKLKEHLNGSKDFKKAAKEFAASFIMVMEPCPEKDFPTEKSFYALAKKGQVQEIAELDSHEGKKADYVFKGSYDNWTAVATGELDPIRAITEKKFEIIAGDVRELLRHVKSINIMISAIKDINTEF